MTHYVGSSSHNVSNIYFSVSIIHNYISEMNFPIKITGFRVLHLSSIRFFTRALYEVNATIFSEYYEDERVLLKDLLYHEFSPIYKSQKFKDYQSEVGLFKRRFFGRITTRRLSGFKKVNELPA